MLVNSSRLEKFPILSLHIGAPTGYVREAIINPKKLQIVGFFVQGPLITQESGDIVQTEAVREFSFAGMIIDSIDSLTSEGEVLKLDKIIQTKFQMNGLKVVTKKGTKLGKVIDYTVDTSDFRIMQIIVQRPMFKAVFDPELVISRREIVEIDNEKIVVKDEEEKIRQRAIKEDFVPNFVNPFRETNYSDSSKTRDFTNS